MLIDVGAVPAGSVKGSGPEALSSGLTRDMTDVTGPTGRPLVTFAMRHFNNAAFVQVPIVRASGATARPGNVGKYIAVGPGQWGTSIGIGKTFFITERYRVQVRADAFNAFNHVNLSNPQLDVTAATFGRILGVGAARSMMLNAKLTF